MLGGRLEVADRPCGVSYWKYTLSTAALGACVFRLSRKASCSFSLSVPNLTFLAGVGNTNKATSPSVLVGWSLCQQVLLVDATTNSVCIKIFITYMYACNLQLDFTFLAKTWFKPQRLEATDVLPSPSLSIFSATSSAWAYTGEQSPGSMPSLTFVPAGKNKSMIRCHWWICDVLEWLRKKYT